MPDQFMVAFEQRRSQLEALLEFDPKGKDRFIQLALNAVLPHRDCSVESRMKCIWDACVTELELGTVEHWAYVVPYKGVLQFQVSYTGLIRRLRETGAVANIYARVVREKDDLVLEESSDGSQQGFRYRMGPLNKRGEIIGAFAAAVLPNGVFTWEALELADIAAIKKAAARQQGPQLSPAWREWEPEMIKKSAIRRLAKRLPGDVSKQRQLAKWQAVQEIENRGFSFENAARTVVDAGGSPLDAVADDIPDDTPAPKAAKAPEPPKDEFLDLESQDVLEKLIVSKFPVRQIPQVLEKHAGVKTLSEVRVSQLASICAAIEGEQAR
jgi:phage RecT family recombinase